MEKRLIIFDFDGVLADSFDVLYKINALAFEAQGDKLTKEQYCNFFIGDLNKNVKEFCYKNGSYGKIRDFKKKLKDKWYKDIKLFPHTKFLVSRLKEYGVNLGIISATDSKLIKKLLSESKLDGYFDFILSSAGASKIDKLRQAIKLSSCKVDNTYFITDTCGDISYGKEAGIKTIAILWGFHNEELLKKGNPDFILKNHEEIFSIINN